MISPADRIERRLLILAGAFLATYSMALTLSSAARLRSWQVDYRWAQWVGFAIWVLVAWQLHRQLARRLPERDPYIFPVAALLSGWGLLTIWRLSGTVGSRQTAWLLLIGMLMLLALRFDFTQGGGRILSYLRRFKYVWLTTGLVLTAATLFLGTNPLGAGPRLWLGCCGFYFQPSEPLKLLLIVYLAAYLADRQDEDAPPVKLLPLLIPTLLMTGLALLLLVFQRDLGTAAIFMGLYAVIVYTGTGKKKVLLVSALVLIIALAGGYGLFDVVKQRVDAWINPWLDPAGRSFQIVQSLLAVANGGLFGRGIGMGSPSLVPIAQSDFIFAAIGEESGLLGAIGILALLAVLANRGLRIALRSSDTFQRLLATGLVAHLVGQSVLIIAGNLRLLPLTGVTLPFVSNGGSSLLVSFFELLCLLLISARQEEVVVLAPEKLRHLSRINVLLTGGLLTGLLGSALAAGWWSLVRAPDLVSRTDDPRRAIADRYVKRGTIFDSHGTVLAESVGLPGDITRKYPYSELSPLLGYTDPVYGQAGLEASLDPYLRGMQGYPTLTLWWERLLYGQPPPGLDVRLSLDSDLQEKADSLLAGHKGAVVLLNAHTGEVLALASSPTFDANRLETDWESLVNDPDAPLFDRVTMGLYPAGNAMGTFLLASSQVDATDQYLGTDLTGCAYVPSGRSWGEVIAAGCTDPIKLLLSSISGQELIDRLDNMGFYTAPVFPVETLSSSKPEAIADNYSYVAGGQAVTESQNVLQVSPLQMVLAAAALSNQGERPAPTLAIAVNIPTAAWVMLDGGLQEKQAFQALDTTNAVDAMSISELPIWQAVAIDNYKSMSGGTSSDVNSGITWYIGGTSSAWQGVPLAIAVLLEENNPNLAQEIGQSLFQSSMYP